MTKTESDSEGASGATTWMRWGQGSVVGGLRVLLLSLNWTRTKDPRTPLATAYLCSWLSVQRDLWPKIRVGFLDKDVKTPVSEVARDVTADDPGVLGIGVYVWNNLAVGTLVRDLRSKGFRGKIVLGGPEISYATDDLPSEFVGADYFVKGEGEVAFEEILRATEEGRVACGPGIFTANSASFEGQAHLPKGVEPVQPQSVPELLPLIVKNGFGRIEFQRGCIYGCTFCAFPFKDRAFQKTGLGSITTDLRNLRSSGVRELAILDPVFFVDKSRALDILRALEQELPRVRLEIQSRLEHLDVVLIEQLAKMNVLLECGVQSLDPVVERAIKRAGDPRTIEESLQRLHQRGIAFETHLIFGLPFQTLESLLSDIDYLLRFQPKRLRLFPLLDHRGTELSAQTRTTFKGRLTFADTFPRQVVETEWMSREEISALVLLHEILEESPDPWKDFSTTKAPFAQALAAVHSAFKRGA